MLKSHQKQSNSAEKWKGLKLRFWTVWKPSSMMNLRMIHFYHEGMLIQYFNKANQSKKKAIISGERCINRKKSKEIFLCRDSIKFQSIILVALITSLALAWLTHILAARISKTTCTANGKNERGKKKQQAMNK